MEWTTEQEYAINMPVSDMIVSAAAGSGKTAVMAERIMKRLTQEPCVDIDKILVVTYTSAAASEIKERIMKKIVEELNGGGSEFLSNQLLKLPYANISTIHSFCLNLIKKYFYLLDVDPGVKIADETQTHIMKKQCVDKVMTNHYDANDQVFLTLVSDYAGRTDDFVAETVIKLYDFSITMPESRQWLESLCVPYANDTSEITSYIVKCASMMGKTILEEYERAIELCKDRQDCTILCEFLKREALAVSECLEKTTYVEMYEALNNLSYENWRSAKGDSVVRETCKGYRDKAKEFIVKKVKTSFFAFSPEEIDRDNKKVLPFVNKLSELALEFSKVYLAAKKEKNLIDFSDFEHMALRLLSNDDGTASQIAYAVSESFEEIYIDEYQDCNNIQNRIFNLISGAIRNKPNVFCVGDMKQSIYGFRDSNPLLFRDKCDRYKLYDGKVVENENKILLNANFRSRKSVINFVNFVFSQIMSRECGDIDYDERESLNYGANYEDINSDTDFVDIDIIDMSDTFGESFWSDSNKDEKKGIEAEAIHVASKIKKMISEGYILSEKADENGKRGKKKATYRDFVILLRSNKTVAPIFEKALSDAGIPAYCDSGTPYFDTEEIKLLMSFLKVVDNPDDDISLVAVMKNPIFGIDENQLMEIRLSNRHVSYYECVKNYCSKFSDPLSEKARKCLERISEYHLKSRYMDANEFLRFLVEDISYYAYLSSFEDGKLKKANVHFFLQKAKEFEKDGFRGIHSFVDYVENYADTSSKESAKIIGENDNVVRIMSIHKSKGLEFPVVFLCDCAKGFNKRDVYSRFIFHKGSGIGVESVYRQIGARFKTVNKIAIGQKLSYERVSEELRVLYVALTRASEKLIITANVDNGAILLRECEKHVELEGKKINPHKIYKSGNFLNLILMGIMRSEGCVIDGIRQRVKAIPDESKTNINLINISSVFTETSLPEPVDLQDVYDGPTKEYESFKSVMQYSYPHREDSSLPSNMTVTELKNLYMQNEDIYNPFDEVSLATPKHFGKKRKPFGAALGTLVHYVMEKIDFSSVKNEESVIRQLDLLVENNLLTKEEREMIDSGKIAKFFNSDIGVEMRKCFNTLKKEFSFKYLEDAGRIFSVSSDEGIVVQGTIDAFFEDERGDLVVVDYKTDTITDSDIDSVVERYRPQLDYYAKALESIRAKKVSRKILYLFDADMAVSL